MCSELPEYSGKVKLMQALSPTVYMKQTRSPVLKFISFFKGPLLVLLNLLGGHEISLNTKLIQQFRNHICSANEITSRICGIFDFVLCGFNWNSLNRTLTPIIVGHASQGASTKQIHHYAQLHRNLYFRRFDHGPIRNRIRYQSLSPPSYNLSQTQCRVVLHHGAKDWLASGSDVTNLQDRLPNCIESRKVKLESFTHFDFVISKDVRSLVYNRVVDLVVTNQIQPQRPDENRFTGSSHDPSTPSQLIPQWNQGQSEAEINVHGDRAQGILQNPNLNWSLQHPIQIVGQQDVQQETLFAPRPVQVDIKLQRPDENGFTANSYDPSTPSQLIPQWNQGQSEAEINVHGDRAQGILQNPNLNWSLQHPIQIVGQQDVQQETLFEPRPVQVDIKLQRPDENGFTENSYDPSTPSQLRPQWNQGQSEVEINVHGDRVQGIPQNPNINWSLQHPIQIVGQQDVQQETLFEPRPVQVDIKLQRPDENGSTGNSYDPSTPSQLRPQWNQGQSEVEINVHGDRVQGIPQNPNINWSLQHPIQIGGQQDVQQERFIIPPAHFLTQADIETDGKLKTVELIKKYGYPVETHFVTTRDGYKLCMHRMPRPGAQPILLVHGLMSSSAAWVMLGPSNGLAYILFQQGYDVWMLNTRGNIYSKEHTKKGITMKEYWDFSFHDIGTIDVPSSIDLILERTHFHQIQYIGHSQGSTVFFVMCSELPEYSGKVKLMQALSPTVYMKQTRSPVLKFISFFKGPLLVLLNLLGGHEISLNTKLIQQFRNHICSANEITSRICGIFDFVLCGFNWDSLNRTLTPIIVGHASQGASTKQIHHYAQLHRNLYFRRFDHGPIRNRIRYQSLSPPSYNLSQTQCRVVLHHGAKDWLASGSDVTNLQDRLPNCIESRKVEFESFTHFDFVISKDVRSLVYNRVVDLVVTNQIQPQRPDEGSSHDPSTPSQLRPQWNQGQSEAEINVHGDRAQGILQNPNLNWSLQHPIQIVGQQDVQQETLFEPRPVQVEIKLQRPDENGFTGNSYDPSTPSQLRPQWNQGQSEAEINVHGDRAQGILQNPNLNWSLQHPIQIVGQQDVQQETLFEPRPVQVDIKLQRPDENGFTGNSYDPSTPSQLRPQWNQGQSEVEINVHGDRVQGIPQNPNINWSLQHPIQIGGQQDVQQERFIIPPAHFLTQADIETDGKLKTVELIKKYGYPVETHFVTTRDGYKLCMHRMPRPGAQPILLVHGLMSSSAAWVMLGPSNGLAYILFQQGYDVWMLNTRGNIYSKEHTKKGITMKEYWDFSFHDIGTIDVPSSIDLILERTHFHQIQYIGHSQGSTVFFVMCSELPEYSGKVKLMQALSPTVYMKQTRSPVLKFISFFKGPLLVLLNLLGGHEISLNTKLIQQFRNHICSANEITSRICGIFDFVLCGFNWDSLNRTLTPIIVGHASQGASTKQIHHYAQLHRNLYFRRFDHGPIRNRIRYQSLSPPSYNLSQTQCRVVLHHGAKDWLASGSDVTNLQDRLPNCIESRKVKLESFTHFDFVISKDVRSLVYNRVIDLVVKT
uniref:Uncharacterized protein, isoform F n=1 Tax=Drosophila pseudoobscura pseudoobscura TaxID=46245 RepID=B5DUQ2_DROPS